MGRITKEEEKSFLALRNKSEIFLNENFHKFKEATKIRVAIDILKIAYKGEAPSIDNSTHIHLTTIQSLHDVLKSKHTDRISPELIATVEANGHINGNGAGEAPPIVFRVD